MSGADVAQETRRWLRFAEQDLAAAAALTSAPGIALREVCYLAQQVAEKAVNAIFVVEQVEFPRSHDLALLVRELPARWAIPLASGQLDSLIAWNVEARYPGAWPEPTDTETRSATGPARRSGRYVSTLIWHICGQRRRRCQH